jgi:hypothetical protein
VATCRQRPFGSTPSSYRRVLSANRTLTLRARPPTGADQVQTAARQFRQLSNGDATARPHRSPSLLRNASTRWYSPAQLSFDSHEPMSQRPPYPRTNSPWAVPLKPPSAGPGPTKREPRSHCFDVTHQVRGRAAKRARHRRGHIFSPGGWRPAAKWASSSRRTAKRSQAERRCGSRKLARCPRRCPVPQISSSFGR